VNRKAAIGLGYFRADRFEQRNDRADQRSARVQKFNLAAGNCNTHGIGAGFDAVG
jgi:hypothetical protein